MAPELADHAYGHGVAVLGDAEVAASVATSALRTGGRARPAVLAFARHLALEEAAAHPPVPPDGTTVPADITELATALAGTRPPAERSVVDLALRHGLDRAGLARALGLAAAEAGTLSTSVADAWGSDLDPVLLAWLGPRGCDGLRQVLVAASLWWPADPETGDDEPTAEDRPPPDRSLEALLGVGPAVAAHVETCEVCADRRRAMVSVHALVGLRPLEAAPEPVRAAARRSPFRTAALPPPWPAHGGGRRVGAAAGAGGWRPSRTALLAAAAAGGLLAVALLAVGILRVADRETGQDRRNSRVAALTKLPAAGSSLTLTPSRVRPAVGAILLRNTSGHQVSWTASVGAAWLDVAPSAGLLSPGGVVELDTRITSAAPEGDQEIPVTVSGDDGSTAAAVVVSTVDHPPTLAATISACAVTATAEDETDVKTVFVHWRPRAATQDRVLAMNPAGPPGVYVATMPSTDGPTSWWVSAVDGRGNRAQTDEKPVATGSC